MSHGPSTRNNRAAGVRGSPVADPVSAWVAGQINAPMFKWRSMFGPRLDGSALSGPGASAASRGCRGLLAANAPANVKVPWGKFLRVSTANSPKNETG